MLKLAKTSLLAVAVMATSVVASDILITVNGKNITKQDAQAFVSASAPQANFMELPPAEKKMVTDRLVEKVLFTELAAQEGIDKKPEFKRNMEKIKDELLVNMWMKEQLDNAIVSESEAKAFYDKNSEKFMEKASMRARHILLENEKDAQDIIDTLKPLKGEALKTKFIELAKSKSTGPSGPNGGDLGTFSKGQMVPEFSEAVWALENGKITTKPVKTKFGYHVIYLETKTEAKPAPYEKVKDNIIALLKQQQFTVKIKEVAKELKSKATIVDMTEEANTTK
ncbi:peptidylprolyl isomerase [Sulfurovum sp. XGS-02]|uniref:peptidylprolyl isomerase n=1 Tax=Sulfurovum sp. XGS-02 TaxID=2925411 RepID=UPI00205C2932|nr:peptidylprolyl isomerase [Sulfurovum sp. XGS-02]UPT77038.1 peptidylprolyl isomerase [Sulfurovum sp. XGS-02]